MSYNTSIVEIDKKKYYYKRNESSVELLSEKVADLFDIEHATYIPFRMNDKEYYLSEDLNNKGKFITAYEAGIHSSYIDDIVEQITQKYYRDSKELIDDLIKMYFMDIMILLIDRHNENWGFLEKDNRTKLCILDNDLAFIDTHTTIRSIEEVNSFHNSLEEVKNIYETFPQYYVELFDNMLDTLDHNKLLELIKQTEMQIRKKLPHKESYIKRFDALRKQIFKIRKENIKQKKYTTK